MKFGIIRLEFWFIFVTMFELSGQTIPMKLTWTKKSTRKHTKQAF